MDNQAKPLPPVGRLSSLCREIVGLLGLRQGSVEIHCHKGRPQALHVIKPIDGLDDTELCGVIHDKSIKFDDRAIESS